MSNSDNKNSNTPAKGFAIAMFDYIEIFVIAAAIVLLILNFFLRLCVVQGPSMNQTLFEGEKLVVSDLFYTPVQGDIVIFHQTGTEHYNEPIVKRVIATGGQFVKIDYINQKLYVSDDEDFTDSEIVDESAYVYFSTGNWKEAASLTEAEIFAVPEDHLFVLGDNRNLSADSRMEEIGMVDERRVLGRVLFRLAPFTFFDN